MDHERPKGSRMRQRSALDDTLDGSRNELIDRLGFMLFTSEFLGTLVFVYLAQAGVAAFELTGIQTDTINRQLGVLLTRGLAFLFGTLLSQNLSGAHLNPAFTLTSALFGKIRWSRVPLYLLAQYSAAFLAAILLQATYSDKLGQRHAEGLLSGSNATLRAHGNALSTGKLFSSFPPTEVSLAQLFVGYALANSHLMLLLLLVQDPRNTKVPNSLRPVYMAAAMILIQAAFSANGGPVLNPAQDFSPRLYISIFGWGLSAFSLYHRSYWWLCGVLAPHVGAIVGFALHKLVVHIEGIRDSHLRSANTKGEYLSPSNEELPSY